MAKKAAILAVDPVNGSGLFQYLESFFENGIPYEVFAVSETPDIKTNSGITLILNDVVSGLIGREDEFDALVFACGDAVPKFTENQNEQYNLDMVSVIKSFAANDKILIGHCGMAVIYDHLGLLDVKRVAVHPYAKPAVRRGIATDTAFEVDGNIYSAQSENTLGELMPEIIKALK